MPHFQVAVAEATPVAMSAVIELWVTSNIVTFEFVSPPAAPQDGLQVIEVVAVPPVPTTSRPFERMPVVMEELLPLIVAVLMTDPIPMW